MESREFRCQFCGYFPRNHEQPSSGSWYCPKCGKRTVLSQTRSSIKRIPPKRSQSRSTSRDRITSQIYRKLAQRSSPDHGLKEPYLNPKIQPIKPRKRKEIRIFSQKSSE